MTLGVPDCPAGEGLRQAGREMPNKSVRKLVLKREQLSELTADELVRVVGGRPETQYPECYRTWTDLSRCCIVEDTQLVCLA